MTDALMREVREEAGLDVVSVGKLAYAGPSVQISPGNLHRHGDPRSGYQTVVFDFEVGDWTGELRPKDPNGLVLQALFATTEEALSLLADHPVRPIREPLVEYLSGRVTRGAVWVYRTGADGLVSLDWRSV